MELPTDQPAYHCAECWLYEENKEILAPTNFLHHIPHCRCIYPTIGITMEDCNMSEYSNHWPDLVHSNLNPHLSPQTDSITESPDLNGGPWSLAADLDRSHETANIFCPLQVETFQLPIPGSLVDLPDPFNCHLNTQEQEELWFGGHNQGEPCFSEPESFETSAEPDDQKCLEPLRKPIQTVSCKQPDCDKTFGKRSDMDRHFCSIHEGGGILCGDCENQGIQLPLKRKDHFLPHLYKHSLSKEITWKSCKKCPWPLCEPVNQKQSRWFSSQASLEQHIGLRHEAKAPGLYQKVEANLAAFPDSQGIADKESTFTGVKRLRDQDRNGVKKPRCGDCSFDLQQAFYLKEQGETPFIKATDTIYGIQTEMNASMGDYEVFKLFNVTPVEYLALLEMSGHKLKMVDMNFLHAKTVDSEQQKIPVVSFNTSQRSILLRGPLFIVNFCKSFLETDLKAIRSTRPLIYLNSATTQSRLGTKDHLRTDFQTATTPRRSVKNSNKVFTVRKYEDAHLIDLWMKKILPSLFRILDESIGNEYSASLVREGMEERSAVAVIRIESPQVPTSTTRDDIVQQLDESCGVILADSGVKIQFSTGSLILLAGSRSRQTTSHKEDKRELPFHTRYWKYPGMGASIGLLCTEEEFATLGCYVEVDKQKYVMTINHFIEKSYRKMESGFEDKQSLTSPALAKVKTMKEDLGRLLLTLNGDLAAQFRKNFKNREVSMADLDPLPKEMLEIKRKQKFVSEFAAELQNEKEYFKIGSLAHQCKSDGTARLCTAHSTVASDLSVYSALDIKPEEMCHRLDWALFKAGEARLGTNRHRYRFNPDDGLTDYFPVETEYGEGDICQETCIVESNEKVHFVGQTNGRLVGEINATLRAVNYQGRKTLEHHIVMTAEQRKTGKDYAGDSGAVILRVLDNKLVGLVWGSYNSEVVFTPIRTVFADIKMTLKANSVELPEIQEDATSNDVLLISGTESEMEKKRPYKSSDIVLPPLSKEAAEKESQLFAASILESLKNNPITFPSTQIDLSLSAAEKDITSSPTPSLSSSRSPSPLSMPPSPPSYGNLRTTSDTARESLVLILEEASFKGRESSQGCTTDDDDSNGYFTRRLNIKAKPLIANTLDHRRQKPAKYDSYPGVCPPRLLRSLGTWPVNVFDKL